MLPTPNSPLPTGRPRALDETKLREICAVVSSGCGLSDATRYVGCNVSTIRREGRRNPEFAEELRLAQRTSELAPLNAIRHTARRSWRAGAWLMERTDVERYATKNARRFNTAQLKQYNTALVQILKSELHDRMLYRRVSRLFKEALDHCIRQIAAGRDPFPLPPEIARPDSWPAKLALPTVPTSKNGISWPAGSPLPSMPPTNDQTQ